MRVLDVDPNYCYVRFGRSINNSKIEDKGNIFKYVSIFYYYFHNIYSDRKISIFKFILFKFLVYFLIVFISEVETTLFIVTTIPLLLK